METEVIITNGVGTANIENGSYNVTADVPGYDNSTLEPKEINIVEGANEYFFTISADCTLNLHATDDGTEDGNPINGATFIRTDAEGNEYGEEITTNASGNAEFENVPQGVEIYFKQTGSPQGYDFNEDVQSYTLNTCCETLQIENTPSTNEETFYLTDSNYDNLPIESGIITFTAN